MGMEIWTGEVKAGNLGPARGDRLLGEVKGPGLHMIIGDNAGGKTSILRTMAALRDRELLRSSANITDGEVTAYLELAPVRAVFRRSQIATGKAQAPEVTGEGLPDITELPAAIETLIHGDRLKDPEARARRRLGALLAYAPVPATAELVGRLTECLDERSFTDESDFADAGELRAALAEEHPKDLLAAHDALVKLLNKNALVAEKAADALTWDAEKLAAKAAEVAEGAGVQAALLRKAMPPEAELAAELAKARADLEATKRRDADARAQRERLHRLRQSHGERPVLDKAAVDAAYSEFEAAVDKVQAAVYGGPAILLGEEDIEGAEVSWGADLSEPEAMIRLTLDKLKRTVDNREALAAQRRWDEVEAELTAPVEGPTSEEIETAEAVVNGVVEASRVAAAARRFQAIEAAREDTVTEAGRVNTWAADYRKAAKDSWHYLGVAVTETLKLPWLQVDGLEIFLGYVGGQLNDDPELIAQAKRVALAQSDELSPVSMRRFLLEKIREASSVEWRPIDSEERVSTGELHEACLTVMLSRRENLGGILIVPWTVTAALDDDKLREFSGRLREAGIVAFSERPRRAGEPEGLRLEVVR